MLHQLSVPAELRMRWWVLVGLFLAAFVLAFQLVRMVWVPMVALQWSVSATFGLVYILGWVGYHLPYNYRAGEQKVLRTLGLGNSVTLIRGCLYGLLAGFVLAPKPEGPSLSWLPGGLFLVAALTDYVDGYLARKANHATRLGKLMDLEIDSFGVLVATILVVQYGQLPAWYLFAGVAHYAFHYHMVWRERRGLKVHQLAPWPLRRYIGGFHVGFLCVLLFPVFEPPLTTAAAVAFLFPFVLSFGSDWLRCTGRSAVASFLPTHSIRTIGKGFRVLLFIGAPVVLMATLSIVVSSLPVAVSGSALLILYSLQYHSGRAARGLGLLTLSAGAYYGLGAGLTLLSFLGVAFGMYLFLFGIGGIMPAARSRTIEQSQ